MSIHDTINKLNLQVPVLHWDRLPDGRIKLYLANGHKPIVIGLDNVGTDDSNVLHKEDKN